MDDKIKNMIVTLGAPIAQKILMLQAAGLVSHGVLSANYTEVYVSLGMALVGAAWSFWNDYGAPIFFSQMEVLKAKSLAQAEKLRAAGLPQVTASQIAEHSSKMTTSEVTKIVATMPPDIKANVAAENIVKMIAGLIVIWFFLQPGSAVAQTVKNLHPVDSNAIEQTAKPCLIPWDPLKLCGVLTGNPADDFKRVVQRIQKVGKLDIQYAALKAKNANTPASLVRLQCLNGILDMKSKFEDDLKDTTGTVVPRPDPDAITVIEETAELVDALAPQGALFTSCAGAAQLFKTNTLQAINGLVTGAVGLVAMGG